MRSFSKVLSVVSLSLCLVFGGCASQEQPPSAQEESALAHKYALLTTPQLVQKRNELATELGGGGFVFGPGAMVLTAVLINDGKKKKLNEMNRELARRAALEQPVSPSGKVPKKA